MTDQLLTADQAREMGLDKPVPPQREIRAAFVIVAEDSADALRLRASVPTDPNRPVVVVDLDAVLGLPNARGAVPVRVVLDIETLSATATRRDTGQTFTPNADLIRAAIGASPAATARLREVGDFRRIQAI